MVLRSTCVVRSWPRPPGWLNHTRSSWQKTLWTKAAVLLQGSLFKLLPAVRWAAVWQWLQGWIKVLTNPLLRNKLKFRACVICFNSYYILKSEGKVWSMYIHKVNWLNNAFQRFGHLKFSKWPPAAILDLIQPRMAPFDPPSWKPHSRTKHDGDRMTRCRVMAIWNFHKMCEKASEVGRWSVVRRQYSYFSHTALSLR